MTATNIVHVAFDKSLKAYTSFPTASDARLANFILQQGIGDSDSDSHNLRTIFWTFDAIINLVCQPGFSVDELTIRSAADCYEHVGKQRAVVLEERNAACRSASLNVGITGNATTIPSVVLDCTFTLLKEIVDSLVLESFDNGGHHLFNRAGRYSHPRNGRHSRKLVSILQMLSDMSLVQRLWTVPARRVLGRCIAVVDNSHGWTQSLISMRNPIVGPWTQAANIQRSFDKLELLLFKRLCTTRIGNLRSLQLRLDSGSLPHMEVITDIVLGLPLLSNIQLNTSFPFISTVFPDFFKSLCQSKAPINVVYFICQDSGTTETIKALTDSALHSISKLLPIQTLETVHLQLSDLRGNKSNSWGMLNAVVWRRTIADGRAKFVLNTLMVGRMVEDFLIDRYDRFTDAIEPTQKIISQIPILKIPFIASEKLAKMVSISNDMRELQFEAMADPMTASVIFSNVPCSLECLEVHLDLDHIAKPPSVLTQKTRVAMWVQRWGDALCKFVGDDIRRRSPHFRRLRVLFHWSNSPVLGGRTESVLEGEKLAKWERQIALVAEKVASEVVRCKSRCSFLGDEVAFEWVVLFDDLEWS